MLLLFILVNYHRSIFKFNYQALFHGVEQCLMRKNAKEADVCGGFHKWCTASCLFSSVSLPVSHILFLFSERLFYLFFVEIAGVRMHTPANRFLFRFLLLGSYCVTVRIRF